MSSDIVLAYIDSLPPTISLLSEPRVREMWESPSALEGMTVGELAAHLAQTITRVPDTLAALPSDLVMGGAERFLHTGWATTDANSQANTAIRDRARGEAAVGAQAVVESVRAASVALADLLPAQAEDRLVVMPDGVSLDLDDYIITRLLELVVHCDDLAQSVGVPTPEMPFAAIHAVIELLVEASVARHGWTAVLRALSRQERAPKGGISAFGSSS